METLGEGQRFPNLRWKWLGFISLPVVLLMGTGSCRPGSEQDGNQPSAGEYEQVNLVADATGFGANHLDPRLSNAWGMYSDADHVWVCSTNKGLVLTYDKMGNITGRPIKVTGAASSPTGIILNNTSGFKISATGEQSKLLIATEEGKIAAYASGDSARTVVNRSHHGAIYKGLAMANLFDRNLLFAVDFHNNHIDVFDDKFTLVDINLKDPNMPAGYAPFNIISVGGKLFVSYALQDDKQEDEVAGDGNGYIDVYSPEGRLLQRLVSRGALNAPWGMAVLGSRIYVGNFGDGRINAYNLSGTFAGAVTKNGIPIAIEGLWAINMGSSYDSGSNQIFFAAGPADEAHGLYGYLKKRF